MSYMFILVMSYSHFMSHHGHFKSHHGHFMCFMVTLSMIRSLLLFQVSCHMVTINVDMVTFSNIMDIILMLWLLIKKNIYSIRYMVTNTVYVVTF